MSVMIKKINLEKLIDMQWKLDDEIAVKTGIGKISFYERTSGDRDIALLCEIMEAVNELGHIWKYWKLSAEFTVDQRTKALKEIVDVLHFFLAKVIELIEVDRFPEDFCHTIILVEESFEEQIKSLVRNCIEIRTEGDFMISFGLFRGLIHQLGYEWREVEERYIEKNLINHERVKNGY